MTVDVRDDAAAFVGKWRARWPEWEIAQVFIPVAQRPLVEAWFALLQELTDAAWGGGDPTPGLAKLAWWQEELGGWEKGARRHPLGGLLQPCRAPWQALGRALPDLRTLRGEDSAGEGSPPGAGMVEPRADGSPVAGAAFAAAVADVEALLFAQARAGSDANGVPVASGVPGAAAATVLQDLLAERALLSAARSGATAASASAGTQPAARAAHGVTRPRGVHKALVAARSAHPGAPLSPLRALFAAWRGARSAG